MVFQKKLSILWKSDLSDKIKRFFFLPSCVCTTVWMHRMDSNKMHIEKTQLEVCKYAAIYFEQILAAITHETTAVRPPTSHLKNHPIRRTRHAG